MVHTQGRKSARKYATARLGGKKIRYRKGALRRQLGLRKNQKLSRTIMRRASKVPIGRKVDILGHPHPMTPLLKRRLVFGANLMGRRRR